MNIISRFGGGEGWKHGLEYERDEGGVIHHKRDVGISVVRKKEPPGRGLGRPKQDANM